MERNFRKRVGRYIKKNDPVISVVALKDFSFEAITSTPTLAYDNPNNNLILARYHEKSEIAGIKPHKRFNSEVREPDMIPDVLQPLDFTIDWKRQQERAAKRSKGRIDEDEDDLELDMSIQQLARARANQHGEEEEKAPSATVAAAPAAGNIPLEKKEPVQSSDASSASDSQPHKTQQVSTEDPKVFKQMQSQKDNLETIGQAINAAAEAAPSIPDSALVLKKEHQEEHTPYIPSRNQKPESVQQPELDAMKQYREVLNNPEFNPSNIQAQIDAAKAQGYQDGYKQGEVKATLQLQEITKRVVESVEGMVSELAKTRKNILEGAEKNFYEVCQALAQTLIERELKTDPQAFASLIQKAVRESVGEDDFKVAVHPDFFSVLSKTDLKNLTGKIIQDPLVAPGDFRLESKQAIIDGNLKQMIGEILNQADLSLIDKKDKAS